MEYGSTPATPILTEEQTTHKSMPGIRVLGLEDMKLLEVENQALLLEVQPQLFLDAVASHVDAQFRINKDAKDRSGIRDLITEGSQQYNGEYSHDELKLIQSSGGSAVFMNITATKCRAAASWIRDIELATNQKAWTIKPTPKSDLPEETRALIDNAIKKEFEDLVKASAPQPEQPPQQPGQPPQQPQQAPRASMAQDAIREINQNKRDIEEAIYGELQKEAEFEMKVMERQINDQLIEGGWYQAFSEFIDDFVVYPSAFIKGPIVTKDTKIVYENGVATPKEIFCYKNRRVSPYDIYPAPEASSLYDGALCEHLRFTGMELNELIGVEGYKTDKLIEVLKEGPNENHFSADTGIESDKALEEKRGDSTDANRNIYHGIHFFGPIPAKILKEWGINEPAVLSAPDYKEFECEAMVVGRHTIKCILNSDPVLRRPYYTASYQQRPGSIWGRSLPNLMRDIQRMCNATARALANNMALAAGPQIEVYIERLADKSDLEDLRPFKIWQMDVDPSGAGGRGINWFQPSSNANELLTVYKEFELRADDATGIPRYAYGNENSGQVTNTVGGLSILLESASKGVKDAIRNIDAGVVVPRIEFQFLMNILENKIPYTGDVQVEALGSSTLTLKGAEQIKRNEFLQITANPIDQEIMGAQGRAALLREMAKGLNFIEDIVPTRLDMKKKEKEAADSQAQQQQQAQQMAQQQEQANNQRAMGQVQGQMQMNQIAQETRLQIENLKDQRKAVDQQLKALDLQLKEKGLESTAALTARGQEIDKEKQTREIAVKLRTGEGI